MSEAMTAALLPAIQEGKLWMKRFSAKQYAGAFSDYQERFTPLYREAVRSAGEEGLAALAEALLDGLAAGWAKQRPWNRSVVRVEERQMMVCYLSPMLLADPVCAPLAAALERGWAARWPKEAYQAVPQEELQKGFRATFLGIPLQRS